jgi:predicted ATPase
MGLALLTQLPATAERNQLELRLRQLLSIALATNRGFTSNELEDNLQRAQQLCRELEDEAALVPVMIGLTRLYLFRANRAALEELERQEEFLAERVSDKQLLVQLHTQLAWIEAVRGNHDGVAHHSQYVRIYYDAHAHQLFMYSYAGDPFAVALGASGVSLSLAGRLAQGWSDAALGFARAEELHQPAVLTFALLYAGMVKHLCGEYDEAGRLAQQMDALAQEYELPLMVTLGKLLHGGMIIQCGAPEDGVALLTTGLAQYRAMGAQLLAPYFLSFLAEGYRQQGKITEALRAVHEALTLTATTIDVFWEAELYRLKGELLLAQEVKSQKLKVKSPPLAPSTQKAEACFYHAIEIARRQEAKLLELRAVMSLARLWRQQGKKKEARQRLTEIYNWFTEGLDTKDLRAAKALLAALT